MTFLASIVVGLLTGVFYSFFTWWLLTRRFRADLEWCDDVAAYADLSDGCERNQVQIRNIGRRDVIDVVILARLSVRGLRRPGVSEWFTLGEFRLHVLEPGRTRRYAPLLRKSDGLHDRYVAELYGGDVLIDYDAGKPIAVRELLTSHTQDSYLEMTALATDEYSGSRAVAKKVYRLGDIKPGRFVPGECDLRELEPEEMLEPASK